MTICATKTFKTFTIVATVNVVTVSILTRIKFFTFVDVVLTMIADESGAGTIASVFIEQIYALTSVTWVTGDLAFIYLAFTVFASKTQWTVA